MQAFRAALLFVVLAVAGCKPNSADLPVPPAIIAAILKYFTDDRKRFKLRQRTLDPKSAVNLQDTIDHHKGFFIQARAQFLGAEHSDWIIEANQPRLRARLEADLNKAEAFVAGKLGTASNPGPLGGLTEPGSPPARPRNQEYAAAGDKHLDLADVAYTRTNTSDREANQRKTGLRTQRIRRVHGIFWRGAGLNQEVWDVSGNIIAAAMNELLDRRLRCVERMDATISSRQALGGGPINAPAGTFQGPWTDKFRVRPFEYPRIRDSVAAVKAAIGPQTPVPTDPRRRILPPGTSSFGGDGDWLQDNPAERLLYNVPPSPGLYVEPIELRGHWTNGTGSEWYSLKLTPTAPVTAAQTIDLLFRGRFDWWKRTWMFCDHVLSALQVEALLFGLRRRPGAGDAPFNEVAEDEYVHLTTHVGAGDNDLLMADDDDPYFVNDRRGDERTLQIGDQVIFWNSFLYAYLIRNEWRLENALIVDMESDGIEGRVLRKAIQLQGHGISPKRYDKYQADLTFELNQLLKNVRIEAAGKASTVTEFVWNPLGTRTKIVRWDPFHKFAAPGAWWIGLAIGDGTGSPSHWRNGSDIKADIPRAVIEDDVTGTLLEEFPDDFEALFPLYEPRIARVPSGSSTWHQHLANPGVAVPRRLSEVRAGAAEIPGFFRGGVGKPIPIIRPRARP